MTDVSQASYDPKEEPILKALVDDLLEVCASVGHDGIMSNQRLVTVLTALANVSGGYLANLDHAGLRQYIKVMKEQRTRTVEKVRRENMDQTIN